MNIKNDMDGNFNHDGKRIFYLIPIDKGRVFGRFENEKTYRDLCFFNEDGTTIGKYKVYDYFEKLQNITPLLAKEYYLRMIRYEKECGGRDYGTDQMS